jgi:magnesium-transporting ATPase (P-type)
VIGVNDYTKNRRRFSVVVRNSTDINEKESVLFVRGTSKSMIDKIAMPDLEREHFKDFMDKVRTFGYLVMVYGKRILTEEETQEYLRRHQILRTNVNSEEKELEEFYDTLENKIDFVTVLCYKEVMVKNSKESLQNLSDAGIKPWIVSNNNELSAIALGFGSRLLKREKNPEIYFIRGENSETLIASIKSILTKLRTRYLEENKMSTDMKRRQSVFTQDYIDMLISKRVPDDNHEGLIQKYTLIIDGQCLLNAEKDDYVYSHLCLLTFLATNVICYDMSPYAKQTLVSLIKNKFPRDPTVLAVGNGACDIMMMIQADISIECKLKDEEFSYSADINLRDFSLIDTLLLVKGRQMADKLRLVVIHTFFTNFMIIFPVFMFCWYSNFSATPLVESYLILILNLMVFFVPVWIYAYSNDKYPPEIMLKAFPTLYGEGIHQKRYLNISFVFNVVGVGIVNSLIIMLFLLFSYKEDNGSLNSIMYTSSQIVACLHFFFYVKVLN